MKSDANLAFRGVLRFFFSLKTCTKLNHEKKRNISFSNWCQPEALGRLGLVVTSSDFCFQNQMDSLFSMVRVKNLPFFLKI